MIYGVFSAINSLEAVEDFLRKNFTGFLKNRPRGVRDKNENANQADLPLVERCATVGNERPSRDDGETRTIEKPEKLPINGGKRKTRVRRTRRGARGGSGRAIGVGVGKKKNHKTITNNDNNNL